MRIILTAFLAASLAALPGVAQTAAELLQKGIYTQDTAGDLDAAIEIYRQAVNMAGSQREVGAQAQYRLGQALLRKGDTAAAALEFEKLARDYPDQRDLIAKLGPTMPILRVAPPLPAATEFDLSKAVTVQGEVTQVLWMNPRAWLKVNDSAGTAWSIMTDSPNMLLKQNWTRVSLKPGDSVTVTANPALDGSKTVAAVTVIRQSDGTKLFDRAEIPIAVGVAK